jgi:hypothetical protein
VSRRLRLQTCRRVYRALRVTMRHSALSLAPFEKDADRFLAPSFRGVGVSRVTLDNRLTLHVGSDTLVIETPGFLVAAEGERFALEPGSADGVASAGSLLHAVCRVVALEASGRLLVDFADGRRLEVPPDPQFEAWQIVSTGKATMVCRPGGELAFFPGAGA